MYRYIYIYIYTDWQCSQFYFIGPYVIFLSKQWLFFFASALVWRIFHWVCCRYDYIHLPLDHQTHKNMSLAFLNFVDHEAALRAFAFLSRPTDFSEAFAPSTKVVWGVLHGLGPNLAHFVARYGMPALDPPYAPLVFENGICVPRTRDILSSLGELHFVFFIFFGFLHLYAFVLWQVMGIEHQIQIHILNLPVVLHKAVAEVSKIRNRLLGLSDGKAMTSWQAVGAWLTSWPTNWQPDWNTDKLTNWLPKWPANWRTEWPTDRPTDWLIDWLTEWVPLTGWSVLICFWSSAWCAVWWLVGLHCCILQVGSLTSKLPLARANLSKKGSNFENMIGLTC